MGDWDTDFFADNYIGGNSLWVFWFASTIINLVVMLNLLIAILSKTYERVDSSDTNFSYQEKVKIIRDRLYLIDEEPETN